MNLTQVINYQALAASLLQQVAGQKDVGVGFKHDASGTPVTTGFMHGPNGLLSYPGVDQAVFNTQLGIRGIMGQIPWVGTVEMNPLYETITGITEGDTDERDEVCDDAPTGGIKKACIQTATFGWIQRGTQEIDVTRLGQRRDRADPLDLFMVGNPQPAETALPGQESIAWTNNMLVNEWTNLLHNRAVTMDRKLRRLFWTGDPANNTNGYQEFYGMQNLVRTGHQDVVTATACPAMDSLVMDYDYIRVDQNMSDLVTKLTYMTRYVKSIAERSGLNPVRWAFVMREEAFYHVTQAYACAYMFSSSCVLPTGGALNLDVRDNLELRDGMRNGNYLIIDGQRWPVVIDDAIPEESQTDTADLESGCFASDIYLLPFSVMGGRSVLYGEYFQFQNPSLTSVFGHQFLGRVFGAFLEVPRQKNNCFVVDIHIKPRVILRTPHLAAKLTNVGYCPVLHTPDAFPDDPYYRNGGVENRTAPAYNSNWE